MQTVLGVATTVCCFGAAYAANSIFPVTSATPSLTVPQPGPSATPAYPVQTSYQVQPAYPVQPAYQPAYQVQPAYQPAYPVQPAPISTPVNENIPRPSQDWVRINEEEYEKEPAKYYYRRYEVPQDPQAWYISPDNNQYQRRLKLPTLEQIQEEQRRNRPQPSAPPARRFPRVSV